MKVLVKIGAVTDEERERGSAHGVDVISYNQLISDGEAHPVPANPPEPEDIATICYTSGTTGEMIDACL